MLTITALDRSQSAAHLDLRSIPLTAEERERTLHHRLLIPGGDLIQLQLPRGTILQPGDILLAASGDPVGRILAQDEAVYTIRSDHPLSLLRAAYHLGNRHIAMEITQKYLRIKPDHVLLHLIETLGGLQVVSEMNSFLPDAGAYKHHHA
jgi:urease accessory protein